MEGIDNIDIYLKRMAATLADKCWWVEKIPPEIDAVVDYGCAQGDLALYLEKTVPGRFKYIGIDNSPVMLALVEQNRERLFGKMETAFYPTIAGIADRCDTSRAVLVLNSVTHEIFSYLSKTEQNALLSEMFSAGFRAITIRDMNMPELDRQPFDVSGALNALEVGASAAMWREYNAYLDGKEARRSACWQDTALRVAEFLLKYKYTDNWERERKETYFWDWLRMTEPFWREAGYGVAYDLKFHIPFLRHQIHDDFGIDFPVDTHRKILLCREQTDYSGSAT